MQGDCPGLLSSVSFLIADPGKVAGGFHLYSVQAAVVVLVHSSPVNTGDTVVANGKFLYEYVGNHIRSAASLY